MPYTVKSLREKLLLEWTYNTNAIEGNTLTINETKVVLEGITVGGKTLREHLEVLNHRDAIQLLLRKIKRISLKKAIRAFKGTGTNHKLSLKGPNRVY